MAFAVSGMYDDVPIVPRTEREYLMRLLWYGLLLLLWPPAIRAVPDGASYVGRWEIHLRLEDGTDKSYAIVHFESLDSENAGRVIASSLPHGLTMRLESLSLRQGVLEFTLDAGSRVRFRGRRVGERLEGTSLVGSLTLEWFAIRTDRETLSPGAASEVRRVFDELMEIPDREERERALQKFLRDYPDSPLREEARFQLARAEPDPKKRQDALRNFLADYPRSRLREGVAYEVARAYRDVEQRMDALRTFIREFPDSSRREAAFEQVFRAAASEVPPDEGGLSNLIDEYLSGVDVSADAVPGGDSALRRAEISNSIAELLLSREILLERADDLNRQAIAAVDDRTLPGMAASLLATQGRIRYARRDLSGAERSFRKAVAAAPDALRGTDYMTLGSILAEREDWPGALEHYLRGFASSPGRETDSILEEAYRKVHGTLEGLHERVDAALLAKPRLFDPGRYTARERSSRVVLAELFTGAECRPCVAADIAFEGLIERYDRDTVAIVEYHLHIPGPDPMTNTDAEARGAYYDVSGTPTVVIDGVNKHTGGGLAGAARQSFDLYTRMIESRTSAPSSVRIENLRVSVTESTAHASATVLRSDAGPPASSRGVFHVALVEELLHYTGGNGVHFHHFVVRKLMSPPAGIPLPGTGESLRFIESIGIADLEQSLRAYLEKYEEKRPGFRFRDEMFRIDPAQLSVVAFVQDEKTREVLQATFSRQTP